MIKIVTALCNTLAVLAMLLVAAIFIPTFDMDFYRAEYTKYDIYQRIGVVEEQLMAVTKHLTDYMRGRVDDLVIEVEVDGVYREFFNDREKAHMLDVKALFTMARIIFACAAATVLITSFALRRNKYLLARTGLITIAVVTALFVGMTIIIISDFESAFTTFHHIFFNNDLWILNPETDLLINIVPLEFFIDIAVRVGLIFGGLIFVYICLLACLWRYSRG